MCTYSESVCVSKCGGIYKLVCIDLLIVHLCG